MEEIGIKKKSSKTALQVSSYNYYDNIVEPLKMDSLCYGNLHVAGKRPQSQIIPYSLVYIATSLLQIIDTEVTPQWTKSLQISL